MKIGDIVKTVFGAGTIVKIEENPQIWVKKKSDEPKDIPEEDYHRIWGSGHLKIERNNSE